MTRRAIIVIVVCLLVSLNGCKGLQGGSKGGIGEQPAHAVVEEQELSVASPEPKPAISTATSNIVAAVTKVPILYYHSVMKEPGNELRIAPEEFEAHVKYLKQQGYHAITLDQLYEGLYHEGPLPEKPVAITFDDGYIDNYDNALPILEKYGYVATVFVVTSYIGADGFMSWEQLQKLLAKGWSIGAHTMTHARLTQLDSAEMSKELEGSKEVLERNLHIPVKLLAYPYGEYSERVVQKAQELGYDMAVTTQKGWASRETDSFLVKRVYVYANMGMEEFVRRLTSSDY